MKDNREFYTPTMEYHNHLHCYCSIEPPCSPCTYGGALEFYQKYHFSSIENIYDSDWDQKIRFEEILKRLKIIFEDYLDPENTIIVYKEHDGVILPDDRYLKIPEYNGIIIYDKSKLDMRFF